MNKPSRDTPSERILRRAAHADLALTLARWIVRHWERLPPLQRSALSYALDFGGRFKDGEVVMTVQLRQLLEALAAIR